MSACQDIQGVKCVSYIYAQECEIENTIETSEPLVDKDGKIVCAETFGARNRFSIRGKGALPAELVAGSVLADGEITHFTTGVTLTLRTSQDQRGGQYCDWEASGTNYPHASLPTT